MAGEMLKTLDAALNAANKGKEVLGQLGDLQQKVTSSIAEAPKMVAAQAGKMFENLRMDVEADKMSGELLSQIDGILGENNMLVAAFSKISNFVQGKDINAGPQTLSGLVVSLFASDKAKELLQDPSSFAYLQAMEFKHPGYLFRLCMESQGLKDPANIPLNTEIHVLYQEGKSKELVDLIDASMNLTQVIPDPAISRIHVTTRDGKEGDYTRAYINGRYKYLNDANKAEEIRLQDINTFTVIGKDSTTDRKKLWDQKLEDAQNNLQDKIGDHVEAKDFKDEDKEMADKILKQFAAMPRSEKLSPRGHFDQGCCMTAVHLAARISPGYNLVSDHKPKFTNPNKDKTDDMRMDRIIPELINKGELLPGASLWVKGNLSIDDPDSSKSEAKNHWFTYVGRKKDGTPVFVDQFGCADIVRINRRAGEPLRYLHKAYMSPEVAKA